MDKTIYSRQSQCLCNLLVELWRAAGLTQRELAAKLNRERNLIGRLEVGERRLDVVEFYWICQATGVKADVVAGKLMRELEEGQSTRR